MTLGATLRIQDSLQAGRSRFYAEIVRLRQLMDLAKEPLPLLFLLDELLAGTNSHDRRQGAEGIVLGLVKLGAIGIITTHDLSLADIAARLGQRQFGGVERACAVVEPDLAATGGTQACRERCCIDLARGQVLGFHAGIIACDPRATGAIEATYTCDSAVYSCATSPGGRFVFAGDASSSVYCFDQDGTRLWKLGTEVAPFHG